MEKNWLSQSERDLIEKCLKALYISRFDDLPPKTHHIDKLAILLEAPDDIVKNKLGE